MNDNDITRSAPHRLSAVVAAVALALAAGSGRAQSIRTDGSWGRVAQTLNGPTYGIPESLGRVAGSNLFHSFDRFGLTSGETANFTTQTSTLQNVFARVTGGQASVINGRVQLTPAAGSRPDLFLVNPAGVTFGAGASIDVPAAFHAGTANYVKFADGMRWPTGSSDSVLSSAAPEAFGFLAGQRAPMIVSDGANLEAAAGLTLAAGDIAVRGARVRSGAGDIAVAAVGGIAAEVPLVKAPLADGPTRPALALPAGAGVLAISDGGEIGSLGVATAGGNVYVSAGQLDLSGEDSGLGSVATGDGDAGNVTVTVGDTLSVTDQATIASSTFSAGDAGTLSISAASASVTNHGVITTATLPGSTGRGGTVQLNLGGALILGNAGIVDSSTFGVGDAGSVDIHAGSIDASASGRITSQALPGSMGNAGRITIVVPDAVQLQDNSIISSVTQGAGNAGSITLTAGNLVATGGSRVVSGVDVGSLGRGGSVDVSLSGDLVLLSSASIASPTFGPGDAGAVRIAARNITLAGNNTLIDSSAQAGATGNAGTISVHADEQLFLLDGGQIGSNTFGPGNAGNVDIDAGDLSISGDATGVASQAQLGSSGHAGSVHVDVVGLLTMSDSGIISSSTFASGNAGAVVVRAGSLAMADDRTVIVSQAAPASTGGNAGDIDVAVRGDLTISNRANIDSATFATGNAGAVRVAARNITLSGDTALIDSSAQAGATGHAGRVSVHADEMLALVNGGQIGSNTFGPGNAGNVEISAGEMSIVGSETGVGSQAQLGSGGHAGSVQVDVEGRLAMGSSGIISSSTFADGDAGAVQVSAHDIVIDGAQTGIISTATAPGHGNAGSVTVSASGGLTITGGGIVDSSTVSAGEAGTVSVSANMVTIDGSSLISSASLGDTIGSAGLINIEARESLVISNLGSIVSSTFTGGNAGSIQITAGDIVVDGGVIMSQAQEGSTGLGGVVQIDAKRLAMKNQGVITSSTLGKGDAGVVTISAPDISIDNAFIISGSGVTSSGNAGGILIRAPGTLTASNGGVISTSTLSPVGAAGVVVVLAGDILLSGANGDISSGIKAEASRDSSGRTGQMAVVADRSLTLADGAVISVRNDSTATPSGLPAHDLTIQSPTVTLSGGAQITSESANAFPADNIFIAVADRLNLTDSAISTRANNGDGGDISIGGGTQVVRLKNSAIATSVVGTSGDGGDILIRSAALILDTGFIQANTAAADASGGDVLIDVKTLLPSGNSLLVGGDTAYTFQRGVFGANVIQAAAPTGLSGNIRISSPPTDISGSLADLNAPALDLGAFGKDLCGRGAGSSLTTHGRGALPPGAGGFVRPETAPAISSPPLSQLVGSTARLAAIYRCE